MPAIELFLEESKPSGIWYCSECRTVFNTEAGAIKCHTPQLCECGKPVRARYLLQCDECERQSWQAKQDAKEAERFERATKIDAADYKGEQVFWNDKYYDDWQDAIDGYLPDQEPEYVWAAPNIGTPLLDISNSIESLLDEMWEGADESDLIGVPQLQKAVDAFNKRNRAVVMYMPDYSTAILIPKNKLESVAEVGAA